MADEEKKDVPPTDDKVGSGQNESDGGKTQTETPEETKSKEAPVEEPKAEEKPVEEAPAEAPNEEAAAPEEGEAPAAPPAEDEAGSRQEDAGGKAEAEPEPEPEPPSAISPEMQDTTGHQGKMIGAEDVKPGMTIRIHERILDISPKGEERERTQIFEGIVLGIRGAGNKRTITVRKVSHGTGVEKVFPLASPNVTKIEVVKIARVRRAKLTFLKNLKKRFKKKLKETWVK